MTWANARPPSMSPLEIEAVGGTDAGTPARDLFCRAQVEWANAQIEEKTPQILAS